MKVLIKQNEIDAYVTIFSTRINNHRDHYNDLHKISFNCGSVDK